MPASSTIRRPLLGAALLLTLSCGGGDGGGTEPTPNPAPTISAVARDSATAGIPPFSVVLGGTNFMPGVVATFDGNARSTNRQSNSALDFALQAADLATPGDHEIRLKNPEPGGGPSEARIFHVLPQPPVPVLDSLSPDTVVANALSSLVLQVFGHGFVPGAVLRMNGTQITSTRVSDTLLETTIVGGILGTPGSVTLTVFKQGPGGGTSTGRTFVVRPAPAAPQITGIDPDTVVIGPDPIPILLTGTGMAGADSVDMVNQLHYWGTVPTSSTDTTVTFLLDPSWLESLGVPQVRVHTHAGWSPWLYTLEAVNPIPVLDSISGDTLDGAQVSDTMILIGNGFAIGMGVGNDLGQPLTVERIDFQRLRVIVPHATMLGGTTMRVWVADGWDYHFSDDTLAVTIRSTLPVVDSITRQPFGSDSVGGEMAFNIWGHDLSFAGVAVVNGVEHPTSHPNTVLSGFAIDSSVTFAPGTLYVAYRNPLPGGGTSAAFPFIVRTPNAPPVVDSVTPAAARSDSGVQIITVHGHGFLPGSVVGPQPYGPDSTWLLETAYPVQVLDDSTLTFEFPAVYLHAGLRPTLQIQSPLPTARPSDPFRIPVWTTGVRSVETASTGPIRGWISDTIRGKVYATRKQALVSLDPTTGAILDSIGLPGTGGSMTLSPGGELLYVKVNGGNLLSRVDLTTWSLERTIAFGTWNDAGGDHPVLASIVIPSPAQPTTVTVVRGRQFYYEELGIWAPQIVVIDDSTFRPAVSAQASGVVDGIALGDTIVLVTPSHILRLGLDSAGVFRRDSIAISSWGPILSPTRMLGGSELIDLGTGAVIATGAEFGGKAVRSSIAGRFFTARNVETSPGALSQRVEFSSFDLSTGTLIRRIGFNGPSDLAIALATPTGHFFVSGGALFMGGDPPLTWTNVGTVLTDP